MILLEKIYTSDDIFIDLEYDIHAAINKAELSTADYNFHIGEFKVTVEWKETFDIFKDI